jgi:signal transduction histidine kinase/FixJ family two-component response regulator
MVKILIVDDNPSNLLALEALLEHPMYQLISVHSGKEALEKMNTHEFAVVLLDVQMPEMDGFETARAIRTIPSGKSTPIIFMTAIYQERKYVSEGYAAGGVDYLVKPFEAEVVRSKVAVFADLFRKTRTLFQQKKSFARLISIQRSATEALAVSSTAEQAIPEILRAVGGSSCWDHGLFWIHDKHQGVMRFQSYWSFQGSLSQALVELGKRTFSPGTGLVGKAWVKRGAIWAEECYAPVQDELKPLVAFPVPVYDEIYGVMEFYGANQAKDEDLSKVVTAVASQTGQFIERMEALRLAQEAIDARNEFLSIASHELKTPITSLRLQLEMTRRTVKPEENLSPNPSKLAKVLDKSTVQVTRLTNLVEQLLDLSQLQADKLRINFESVNIANLVRETVERLYHQFSEAGSTVTLKLNNDLSIQCDRFRVDQVVTNLLTNAIKYGRGKPVEIVVDENMGSARILVKDSGIGIEKEKIEKIFDRFERAVNAGATQGLGLGLYISKQIVKAHHGSISVDSELGVGSKFTVQLPKGTFSNDVALSS